MISTQFNKAFLSLKVHLINSMNLNKKIFSFEKKCYFFYSMINFFEKIKSFLCLKFFFREKNLDISTATKLLINVDLNDNVSSNINSCDFFDDEILFFIIDFEITFSLKIFNTCFRFVILLFIAVFKYLQRNRTICYIKFSFFFF